MRIKCDECPNDATTVLLIGGKVVPTNRMLCDACRAKPQGVLFTEMTVIEFINHMRQ